MFLSRDASCGKKMCMFALLLTRFFLMSAPAIKIPCINVLFVIIIDESNKYIDYIRM